MLHERLTEDQSEWGLSLQEYQSRELERLHERNRRRSEIALARTRDDKGHFIKATLEPELGVVFMARSGPAYRIEREVPHGLGFSRMSITLPFVSILARAQHDQHD